MNITEFLGTIYLGDRGCKSLILDGWNAEVKMQVTCISRIRSGAWNYYTEEDLPDGYLIFGGVKSVHFDPAGPIPNDLINEIKAERMVGIDNLYLITISVDSVNASGDHTEVIVKVIANTFWLEDSKNPGVKIIQ